MVSKRAPASSLLENSGKEFEVESKVEVICPNRLLVVKIVGIDILLILNVGEVDLSR